MTKLKEPIVSISLNDVYSLVQDYLDVQPDDPLVAVKDRLGMMYDTDRRRVIEFIMVVEGYTLYEIAALFGISHMTVKRDFIKIREELKLIGREFSDE